MSNTEQSGQRRRPWALIAAGLLGTSGVVTLAIALHAQQHPPQPSPSAGSAVSSEPAASSTRATPPAQPEEQGAPKTSAARGPILAAANPTRLSVPSIGIDTGLLQLGLNRDQSIQVPPQTRKARAGWYKFSPSPGQLGPAIILGHVDSAKYGPGVFFKLGALHPGALIDITRSDGIVGVFRVDRVVSYSKNNFPTLEVYGNTDHAALRLITCGGTFNLTRHSYESNIVTYASLVSSHRA